MTKLSESDRVTDLEVQLSYMARQVEELNDVVSAQSKTIDRLEARVMLLMHQAAEAEAQSIGGVVVGGQKPPHY